MGITSGFVGTYFNYIQSALLPILGDSQYSSIIALLLALILFVIALSIIFSIFAYVFGWIERKIMARMQSRHGPTYVGKWGFLQNLADLVKLITKEHIVPDAADKPLFLSSIPLLLAIFVMMLVFIPFTNAFVGIGTSVGLLVVFMLLSFTPLLVFLAGWTSGNKFGSIAAQRSVVMMLSYEIPIVLVVASVALLANSYSFSSIVNAQSGTWYIILMPLGFLTFFIAMLGELDRPPFDLREADSELIAGWLTDVSAPYYGLVLFLDYIRMFVGALLISVLFLGGWLGPSFIPAFAWLMIKVVVISLFVIIVRATTVRMRIDRLLHLGWTYLMPLSVINLLITFVIFIG
ncbi:MAG: NADH-quinone oxidoreductase subunit H [Candidatus Micrarchaeales archaeon]